MEINERWAKSILRESGEQETRHLLEWWINFGPRVHEKLTVEIAVKSLQKVLKYHSSKKKS